MATTPVSLDKWREYFRGANSDIFDIIEHAVMVAACDCPYDFKLKRDRIAEMLFTCKFTKCFGCDRVELAVPNPDSVEKRDDDDDKYRSGIEAGGGSKDTKESKVNDEHRTEIVVMDVNQISNNSYGDVEVLTDEIEEESQILDEVLRIKAILDNRQEESCELLLDSLRRLQLMTLSVEILKDTEIGKSVNAMRKHESKEIRNLVRTLIESWKTLVDAWVDATTAVAAKKQRTIQVVELHNLPKQTAAHRNQPMRPAHQHRLAIGRR
ncbi:UNVERIFIED_CONTAM: putative mediator of RNA polymerase II transcription subunitb [Sesamum calycinum]|uniref:Mediator of RNA polymerase II transcription subunitb n=1 Tax=Sesamum calycinum TaxID=2727403 RepID=A0AAW2N332_9LAMI